MFPSRAAPLLFGLILSCLMTFLISGFATFRAVGLSDNFLGLWMSSWLASWLFAFPVILVVAPMTRKLVAKLVSSA